MVARCHLSDSHQSTTAICKTSSITFEVTALRFATEGKDLREAEKPATWCLESKPYVLYSK